MMSLVGDFQLPPLLILNNIYGDSAKDMLELAKTIEDQINESDNVEFAIPLNVKLMFSKQSDDGPAILLAKAEEGVEGLNKALVVEKAVQPETSQPYLTNDAVEKIDARLTASFDKGQLDKYLISVSKETGLKKFGPHCFKIMAHKLQLKGNNNRYHWKLNRPEVHRYSEDAIKLIIDKDMEREGVLKEANETYRRSIKNAKKRKA